MSNDVPVGGAPPTPPTPPPPPESFGAVPPPPGAIPPQGPPPGMMPPAGPPPGPGMMPPPGPGMMPPQGPGMMPPGPGMMPPPGYGAPMGYGTPQNSSGMGKMSAVPPQVSGLCWGGFFFGWIWGVFNGVLISLLGLIPFVGWVMPWVLLFKGNDWAWQGKRWNSIEHFKDVQHKWTIAGLIYFAVMIVLGILWVILVLATGGASYEYNTTYPVVAPLLSLFT